MPPYSIMIKPASGMCNLRCTYCFYSDETNLRDIPNYGMMSEETAESILMSFFATETNSCSIAFQGGEPTLRGLEFFETFVHLEKKHNKNRIPVQYSIQTNGILLDEKWAKFLKKNNFLVGISLDGTKNCHNRFRIDADKEGSFSKVTKAISILKRYSIDFNVLIVVTNYLAKHIDSVFSYFKKNNICFQQYIPCMDPLQNQRGGETFSLSPEQYGVFLIKLFNRWYQELEKGSYYSIRFFDNIVLMLRAQEPEMCSMTGRCNIQYLVEADGSVFPCDFYAIDKYYLGNATKDSIVEIDKARENMNFVRDSMDLPIKCKSCKWVNLCRNGCRRDRVALNDLPALNYYCQAYEKFFEDTASKWAEVGRLLANAKLPV